MMTAQTGSWLDKARGTSVVAVAQALGRSACVRRTSTGGEVTCPACGAERRHEKRRDRRLSAHLAHGGRGWRCLQCEATGDAIDYVAYHIGGTRFRDASATAKDRVKSLFGDLVGAAALALAVPCAPERSPNYPPLHEVQLLLSGCVRVSLDDQVAGYLRGRGIDPLRVAERDLARALPLGSPRGDRFQRSGHRLIIPLVALDGDVRSYEARLCRPPKNGELKSLAVSGYERRGLFFASPSARRWLGNECSDKSESVVCYVVEGGIDYLRLAIEFDSPNELVIGIVSGSLTPRALAWLPDGAVVVAATDADKQGDEYANKVRSLLPVGVGFERFTPCL